LWEYFTRPQQTYPLDIITAELKSQQLFEKSTRLHKQVNTKAIRPNSKSTTTTPTKRASHRRSQNSLLTCQIKHRPQPSTPGSRKYRDSTPAPKSHKEIQTDTVFSASLDVVRRRSDKIQDFLYSDSLLDK